MRRFLFTLLMAVQGKTPAQLLKEASDSGHADAEFADLEKRIADALDGIKRPPKIGVPPMPPTLRTFIQGDPASRQFFDTLVKHFEAIEAVQNLYIRTYAAIKTDLTMTVTVLRNATKWRRRNAELVTDNEALNGTIHQKNLEIARLQQAQKASGSSEALTGDERAELESLRREVPDLRGRLNSRDERARAIVQSDADATKAQSGGEEPASVMSPISAFWQSSDAGAIKANLNELKPALPGVEGIVAWAKLHLTGRLVLTDRAAAEALQSTYRDPDLLFFSLMLLAHEYRDQCVAPDAAARNRALKAFNAKANALGLRESKAASDLIRAQHADEYSVRHMGSVFPLERALKRGNSFDPKDCFRCYFVFDKKSGQIVVGSMPKHLTNAKT